MSSDFSTHAFAFSPIDYVVFFMMLGISTFIGVYFGFLRKSANTTSEYLMGGKKMQPMPIAVSLIASQLSAHIIMAVPAELYVFGITFMVNTLPVLVAMPFLCWLVIPVFYNNNISNCYKYLELRFDRKTCEIMTICYMLTVFVTLPIHIFTPSLAFSQVTGINIHITNAFVCSICVFYTMFGGIKAVVWTDVIQCAIMAISVAIVGLSAVAKIGGLSEIFRYAQEGHRLDVDFSLDPRSRSTIWNNFLRTGLMLSTYVGMSQSCVQRIVSLPTLQKAKRTLYMFAGGYMLLKFMNCFTGLIMYARYHDCDPLLTGNVAKADKLIPFFVHDVVGHLKGMPGVFISCVFSAALSTVSAHMNSLSGVVYFDYIKPHIQHSEHRANLIMKIFIFFTGIYCILGGLLVERFSSILQLLFSVSGVTLGTVFGVFLLGMLLPKAHNRAAFWSIIITISLSLTIAVGSRGRAQYKGLPGSVDGCVNMNNTSILSAAAWSNSTNESFLKDKPFSIFDISFNWFMPLGALMFFIISITLSYVLPVDKKYKLDTKLLSPIVQSMLKYKLANTEELTELKKEALLNNN